MALTIETAGEERESSIFLKDAPYLWTNLRPFLAASGLTAGKKYRTYLFDPATLAAAYEAGGTFVSAAAI